MKIYDTTTLDLPTETEKLHQKLLDTLHYNPETGEWTWKITTSSRSLKGTKTGNVSTNWQKKTEPKRRYIRFNGMLHLASRLAFFYMEKRWPLTVDHVNRDSLDDRWCNLREATYRENNRNRSNSRHEDIRYYKDGLADRD